jgi:hypothetical protein
MDDKSCATLVSNCDTMIGFDARFRRSLERTISGAKLPDDICRALELDNHTKLINNEHLREFIYAFNGSTLKTLCNFGRLDLTGRKMSTWFDVISQVVKGTIRRTGKRWPYILFWIFVASCINVLLTTYHQYVYDFSIVKLNRLQWRLNATTRADSESPFGATMLPTELEELRRVLVNRTDEARARLKRLGASHLNWSFFVQSAVLMFFIPAISCYVIYPKQCNTSGKPLLDPMTVIDWRQEDQVIVELIMVELEKFASDCMSFARTKLEKLNKDLAQTLNQKQDEARLRELHYKALAQFALQLRHRHRTTIEQLKTLALEGRLNPLTRTAANRDKLAIFYLIGSIMLFSYMQGVLISGYLLCKINFESKGMRVEYNNTKDILNALSIVIMIEFCTNIGFLLFLLFGIILFRQINSLGRLKKLIVYVSQRNDERVRQLVESASHHREDKMALSVSIERDLIMVILQARFVQKSFGLAKHHLSLIAMEVLYFAFATPMALKIHISYFDPEIRGIVFGVGLACTLCCICFLWPLGLLHQCCLKTFQRYWDLVAQLSYYETIPCSNDYFNMNSSFAVSILRRTLADSRQTTDRFACRVFLIPITNNNLIKIAFWAFLLVLSTYTNLNIFGDGINRAIQDPFGLFRDIT